MNAMKFENATKFEVEALVNPRGMIRICFVLDGEEHAILCTWRDAEKLRYKLSQEMEIAMRRAGVA